MVWRICADFALDYQPFMGLGRRNLSHPFEKPPWNQAGNPDLISKSILFQCLLSVDHLVRWKCSISLNGTQSQNHWFKTRRYIEWLWFSSNGNFPATMDISCHGMSSPIFWGSRCWVHRFCILGTGMAGFFFRFRGKVRSLFLWVFLFLPGYVW